MKSSVDSFVERGCHYSSHWGLATWEMIIQLVRNRRHQDELIGFLRFFDSLSSSLYHYHIFSKTSQALPVPTPRKTPPPSHVLAKGTQTRSTTKKESKPTAFSHSFNPLKQLDFPSVPRSTFILSSRVTSIYISVMSSITHLEEPSVASGSRTPRPITLSPSPPCSPRSMTRTMEPDSMVLLRTIDFAARVC